VKKLFILTAFALSTGLMYVPATVLAEETTTEKVKEQGRDVKKGLKKMARKAEDKVCETVNGKLECAAKKVKHGVENAADEVKDKADDVKN
jgi:hypothetical protein